MDEHVRNQHYVPQFLLKNFSSRDKNSIWAYDKEKKYGPKNQERSISRVASEEFFYDQIRNSKVGSLEYALQDIENIAAPIIVNIIEKKTIKSLSEKDREALSFFVAIQYLRTKGHLHQTKYLFEVFQEQVIQKINIDIGEIDVRKLWFSFIEDSKLYKNIIMNKVWTLCESDKSFFISDNPVVLHNSINKNEFVGTLGLDSYGIEIYLPLSASLTLCIFCEKVFQENNYNLNYIDNLINQPEDIENLNLLQVAYSHRFIFSQKDELSSIEDKLRFIRNK